MLITFCMIAIVGGQLPVKDTCVLDFVSKCIITPTPTACGSCVNASSCNSTSKYVLDKECNHAPFSSSTAICLSQVVTDCEHAFNTVKACETCMVLHSRAFKKDANCTDVDLAAVAALCAEIK